MQARLKTYFATALSFFLGCLFCQELQHRWGLSPILSAAALGFGITFIPLPRQLDKKGLQIIFCTGTFLGMSSSEILETPSHIVASSLLGALIYVGSRPYFTGIGGRMGAVALFSTATWLIVRSLS